MRVWQTRGPVALLLWPLSKLYGALLNFRYGLYVMGYKSQQRMTVPVIVVGNIFIGGTGKTPMVIWLVEYLRMHGWNPGVISRGYGADPEAVLDVSPQSVASEVGDEPLLIAQSTGCPMSVGRRRAAVASQLLSIHPSVDIIISDDGLQHYGLARDLEILMFDQRGIGNGFLLPAGPLREMPQRRRDFTILNSNMDTVPKGIGDAVFKMSLQASVLTQLSAEQHKAELRTLRGKKILAAAGIGHPQRFFQLLSQHGLQFEQMPLPDHFSYTSDLFAQKDAEIILITEKDAVKCRQLAGLRDDPRIWVVPVVAELDKHFGPQLLAKISEIKHGLTSA